MRTLVTAILLLVLIPAFACEKDSTRSKPKWSAGMIILSASYSPFTGYHPHFFPGVIVRRDLGQFRLRAATEAYLIRQEPNQYPYPDASYISERSYGALLRAGIEKGWLMKNTIRPYLGADLAGAFDHSDITAVGGIIGIESRTKVQRNSAGLMPFAGIEFMAGKHFSVSFETQMSFLLVSETSHTVYYGGNIDSRPVHSNYFDFGWTRPASATLHFHF